MRSREVGFGRARFECLEDTGKRCPGLHPFTTHSLSTPERPSLGPIGEPCTSAALTPAFYFRTFLKSRRIFRPMAFYCVTGRPLLS